MFHLRCQTSGSSISILKATLILIWSGFGMAGHPNITEVEPLYPTERKNKHCNGINLLMFPERCSSCRYLLAFRPRFLRSYTLCGLTWVKRSPPVGLLTCHARNGCETSSAAIATIATAKTPQKSKQLSACCLATLIFRASSNRNYFQVSSTWTHLRHWALRSGVPVGDGPLWDGWTLVTVSGWMWGQLNQYKLFKTYFTQRLLEHQDQSG